jgi:hypothetical protein
MISDLQLSVKIVFETEVLADDMSLAGEILAKQFYYRT